eukprot:TRINITY_DN231_c0_g1_i5.p1 TRINITY_DN231_c0_g1~~TRINITY_DN231_c0_g1_i5.p1  ORF type:complete len:931 (+),score=169.93 TRINITY_DN231_c0_g1_i5:93-2885(+)
MRSASPHALIVALCWLVVDSEAATTLSGRFDRPRDSVDLKDLTTSADEKHGYVAAGHHGVLIYDLSIPTNPKVGGTLKTRYPAQRVIVVSGMLYVATHEEVTAYSLQYWDSPTEVHNSPHVLSECLELKWAPSTSEIVFIGSFHSTTLFKRFALSALTTTWEHTYSAAASSAQAVRHGSEEFMYKSDGLTFTGTLAATGASAPVAGGDRTVTLPTTLIGPVTAFSFYHEDSLYIGCGSVFYVLSLGSAGAVRQSTITLTAILSAPIVDIRSDGGWLLVLTTNEIVRYNINTTNGLGGSPTSPLHLKTTSTATNRRLVHLPRAGAHHYILQDAGFVQFAYSTASSSEVFQTLAALPTEQVPLLASSDTHVFKVSSPYGIEVFDRSSMLRVGFYSHPHMINGMAEKVVGNRLYFASSEVFTLDVSNPAAPLLLEIYSQHGVEDMYVEGSTLYLACGSAGLVILDTENSPMRRLGVFDTPGTAKAVTVSGTTAYIADGTSLQLVNVCSTSVPTFIGKFDIVGAKDVHVRGTIVYVTSETKFTAVDVSTPATPVQGGTFEFSNPFQMAVSEETAFLKYVTLYDYVTIVDISAPHEQYAKTTGTTNLATGMGQSTVHVSGDHLFIADTNNGLQRLTISRSVQYPGNEMGCLHEVMNGNPIMPIRVIIAAVTAEGCASACGSEGHTRSGLTTTGGKVECCCGNSADFVGSTRSDTSECTATGAAGRVSVRSAVPVHVGCYTNYGPAGASHVLQSSLLTVSECSETCRAQGSTYSSMQNDLCRCGNDIGLALRAPAASCPSCTADSHECRLWGQTSLSIVSILKPVSLTLEVQTGTGDYSQSAHSFPVEVEYWDGSVQIVGSVVAPAQGSIALFTIPTAAMLPREVRLKEQGGDGWNVKHVKFSGPTTTAVKWRVDGATGMWIKDQEGQRLGVWIAP